MSATTITLGSLTINDTSTATADADGNVWTWSELAGWFGNPAPVYSSFDRGGSKGLHTFGRRYQGRPMTLTGFVRCGSQTKLFAAMDTLESTFDLVASSGTLTVNEPTPKQATVILNGSPDVHVTGGTAGVRFQVPLLAPDPRKYSTTLHSAAVGSHTNAGNAPTAPTMTVVGAATNPQWTLSGALVKFDYSLAGGATLVVNFDTRTAVVDGTTDIRADLNASTEPGWFQLAAGANTVAYSGGGTATLAFRDAWY